MRIYICICIFVCLYICMLYLHDRRGHQIFSNLWLKKWWEPRTKRACWDRSGISGNEKVKNKTRSKARRQGKRIRGKTSDIKDKKVIEKADGTHGAPLRSYWVRPLTYSRGHKPSMCEGRHRVSLQVLHTPCIWRNTVNEAHTFDNPNEMDQIFKRKSAQTHQHSVYCVLP